MSTASVGEAAIRRLERRLAKIAAPENQYARLMELSIDAPERVAAALEEEARCGNWLALHPEPIGGGVGDVDDLSLDPRHVAFQATLSEAESRLARLGASAEVLDFPRRTQHGGSNSDVYRIGNPNPMNRPHASMDIRFFKPFGGRNSLRPLHEVAASRFSRLLGLAIVPLTAFHLQEGELGSAQQCVPNEEEPYADLVDPRLFVHGSLRTDSWLVLLEDPRYEGALSDLRALAYIIGSSDIHPENLFWRLNSEGKGEVRLIDNEHSFSIVLPVRMKVRPIAGMQLPERYRRETANRVFAVSREIVDGALADVLSPAEIDAVLIRLRTVQQDIGHKGTIES